MNTMNEALRKLAATPLPDIGFPMKIVGGAVRDALLGVESKDIDLTVVAPSFDHMLAAIFDVCGEKRVFKVSPDTFTVRAKGDGTPALDFVLARKDGPYTDGRRPDWVKAAGFLGDAERRDFTVNAIGLEPGTGELFDPTGGVRDLKSRRLRFVGDPDQRITEDALRVVRAFRFKITKGFVMTDRTFEACVSLEAARKLIENISTERIRDELEKAFAFDTLATLELIGRLPGHTRQAMFRDGLRLAATMRSKPVAE